MMVKVVKPKRKKVASTSKSINKKRVLTMKFMSQQITPVLAALIHILST
jgi:hypothetical protein